MNLGFMEIINAIEAELSAEYWPGAIHWADDNFDDAWTKAILRLQNAIDEATSTRNWRIAEYEGQRYKHTILSLLRKYKEFKKIDDAKAFLSSINKLQQSGG